MMKIIRSGERSGDVRFKEEGFKWKEDHYFHIFKSLPLGNKMTFISAPENYGQLQEVGLLSRTDLD